MPLTINVYFYYHLVTAIRRGVPYWYKVKEGDATMITRAAVFVWTNVFFTTNKNGIKHKLFAFYPIKKVIYKINF